MKVKERIKEFCGDQKMAVSFFERQCGLANGYVNSIRSSIGMKSLEKILRAFPEMSRDWLIYGEGDMLRSNGSVHQMVSGSGNLSIAAGAGSKIISEKNHTSSVPGQPISSVEDALREINRLRRENAELRERVAAVEGSNRSLEKINEGLLDRLSRR